MRFLGLVLVVVGVSISARSFQLLLGKGRPKRGPQPSFVLAGPYLWTRNPALGGLLLAVAGSSLATVSLPIGLASVVAAAAMHAWVLRVEEPRLRERFGEAYDAYLLAVPRWIPSKRARLRYDAK